MRNCELRVSARSSVVLVAPDGVKDNAQNDSAAVHDA